MAPPNLAIAFIQTIFTQIISCSHIRKKSVYGYNISPAVANFLHVFAENTPDAMSSSHFK